MLEHEHIKACSFQATHHKISPSGGTCPVPVRPTDIQRTLKNEIKIHQYIKTLKEVLMVTANYSPSSHIFNVN